MVNKNILKELEEKRKGHILFNYQIAHDLFDLPKLLEQEIVVNFGSMDWFDASKIVLIDETGKHAAETSYKMEAARKYIATQLLTVLEQKYPQIKEYEGSSYLPIFLRGDRKEYLRKRESIYTLKDVEDILEVEGIQLNRVHFIMNNTRSDALCDGLSILLSDDTPFSVSIYCSPNGFYTYYIPDSKEKIHLNDAYNYTEYNKFKPGRMNKAKKSKKTEKKIIKE